MYIAEESLNGTSISLTLRVHWHITTTTEAAGPPFPFRDFFQFNTYSSQFYVTNITWINLQIVISNGQIKICLDRYLINDDCQDNGSNDTESISEIDRSVH